MPKNSRTPVRTPETLWAIRPDAYAQVVAALEAGEPGALATEPAEARTLSARGGNGGAIAVIPIQGVIRPRPSILSFLFGGGGASVASIRRMLRAAVGDSSIGAIVLDVDSPGGYVDGVPELATEIREARSKKPIVAVANTHAASAAYWLAAQASELYVSPSGQVGSIGVFITHEEYSKLDERIGITTTLISAGRFKTEGNPYEPLTDEARDAMQATVDEYYDMFVGAVAKGRKTSASTVKSGFGEGRMVLAKQAKQAGMVDEVGVLEDAIARAADLASGSGRGGRALDGLAPAEADQQLQVGETVVSRELLEQVAAAVVAATPSGLGLDEPAAEDDPDDPDEPVAGDVDEDLEDEGTDPWAEELAATSPSFRAALARQT